MAPLTHQDLADVKAQWEEWTSGLGYDLDVQVVGEHSEATMDQDRPLGAILTAKLSLRVIIIMNSVGRNGVRVVMFDETLPYDGGALRASVRALSRTIATRAAGEGGADD